MTQVTMTLTKGQGQGQIFPKMIKKRNNWPYHGGYFFYRLHTRYQGTTHHGTFIDPSADDLDLRSRSKVKVKFSPKWVKKLKKLAISQMLFHLQTSYFGHILDAISPTDFIISIITAFCDSFGRCPLVEYNGA